MIFIIINFNQSRSPNTSISDRPVKYVLYRVKSKVTDNGREYRVQYSVRYSYKNLKMTQQLGQYQR